METVSHALTANIGFVLWRLDEQGLDFRFSKVLHIFIHG
jgi:hypothetical protein